MVSQRLVGDADGKAVGLDESGDAVGSEETGRRVGMAVGAADGTAVGLDEAGDAVGLEEAGDMVGLDEAGGCDGSAVGDGLGPDEAGDAVGAELVGAEVVGKAVGADVCRAQAPGTASSKAACSSSLVSAPVRQRFASASQPHDGRAAVARDGGGGGGDGVVSSDGKHCAHPVHDVKLHLVSQGWSCVKHQPRQTIGTEVVDSKVLGSKVVGLEVLGSMVAGSRLILMQSREHTNARHGSGVGLTLGVADGNRVDGANEGAKLGALAGANVSVQPAQLQAHTAGMRLSVSQAPARVKLRHRGRSTMSVRLAHSGGSCAQATGAEGNTDASMNAASCHAL